MAFTVLLERLEFQIRSAQQAAWTARAMGSSVDIPSLDDAIAEFERIVASEPEVIDDVDRELREALGLRSGRG